VMSLYLPPAGIRLDESIAISFHYDISMCLSAVRVVKHCSPLSVSFCQWPRELNETTVSLNTCLPLQGFRKALSGTFWLIDIWPYFDAPCLLDQLKGSSKELENCR